MVVKDRSHIFRCALREIYFGELLHNELRVARYETFFIRDGDYWLVFRDEGVSMHQLLYSMKYTDISATLEPSSVWYRLRASRTDNNLLKGLMHEVISSVAALHDRGIMHRDLKPSNIVLNAEMNGAVKVLLIDFSSAVDADSLTSGLYGATGPTLDEASAQYIPPECIFAAEMVPYNVKYPMAYDAWSIGVIFLEIFLGTADVFTVDQRTLSMLSHRMKKYSEKSRSTALLLASMADYCIFRPEYLVDTDEETRTNGDYSEVFGNNDEVVSIMRMLSRRARPVRCSIEQMAQAIQSRDPLGIGFHEPWGLDLLYRLLSFNPSERLTLQEALDHAYFKGPHRSDIDGSTHGTRKELLQHNCILTSKSPTEICFETASVSINGDLENFESAVPQPTDLDIVLGSFLDRREGMHSTSEDSAALTLLKNEGDFTNSFGVETYSTGPMTRYIGGGTQSNEIVDSNSFQAFISSLNGDIRSMISVPGHTTQFPSSGVSNEEEKANPYHLLSEGVSPPGGATGANILWSTMRDDPALNKLSFTCPTCGRTFAGSYESCLRHISVRQHGHRCLYNSTAVDLPECISEHVMLPIDPASGWCDLKGRRQKMEDSHAVVFSDDLPYKYFAVFDGTVYNIIS